MCVGRALTGNKQDPFAAMRQRLYANPAGERGWMYAGYPSAEPQPLLI